MNPFADLSPLLAELRTPAVRDLAWTLLSPPLLEALDGLRPRHPLAACEWAARPERLADWLRALDRQPERLLGQLPAARGNRLGRYYEQLWQYALDQAPGIRLLAANLVIREGGRTLGELDLLLEDDAGLQHIELAVKFYLGPARADGGDAATWLGPGRLDRLDLKLEHLRQHQLRLTGLPAAQAQLQRLSTRPVQASPWLGGYLFYPWRTPCRAPHGSAAQHLHGVWLRRRDWPSWQSLHPGGWQPLPRMGWLAPAQCTADECWEETRLAAWLAELPADAAPRMLVRLLPGAGGRRREQMRIFLVDDRWPQAVAQERAN
ncbi:DUF1853 family protein [Pseudomonas stutzeri]|nr:DUF1853 family protein [Stutzerimonas stutzeri]